MNNFKKFIAILLGIVMACVFATSAFADTASDKALIKGKMSAYGLSGYEGVIDGLSDSGVAVLMANKGTLIAQANNVQAYLGEAHSAAEQAAYLQNTLANVSGILSSAGINASLDVSVSGNTVVVTATANGVSRTGTKTAASGSSNPIITSSGSVIKTTGDNSAVVFAVAALAVAGVLGMAVRKERAL